MNKTCAKDLFQLQTELVEMKVDMAATKAIDRVLQKIDDLKSQMHGEIHGLKHDMNQRFSKLDTRVVAIETKLGMIGKRKEGFYNRFMDYSFKAGYGVLTSISIYFAYLLIRMH